MRHARHALPEGLRPSIDDELGGGKNKNWRETSMMVQSKLTQKTEDHSTETRRKGTMARRLEGGERGKEVEDLVDEGSRLLAVSRFSVGCITAARRNKQYQIASSQRISLFAVRTNVSRNSPGQTKRH